MPFPCFHTCSMFKSDDEINIRTDPKVMEITQRTAIIIFFVFKLAIIFFPTTNCVTIKDCDFNKYEDF